MAEELDLPPMDANSSWNCRVFRTSSQFRGKTEYHFNVHEAYYHKRGDRIPIMWSQEPTRPYGGTVEELAEHLRQMLKATECPVLECIDEEAVEVKE